MSNWRFNVAYASAVLLLISAFVLVYVDYWFPRTIHTHNFSRLIPLIPVGQLITLAGLVLALFAKGHTRIFFTLAAVLEFWCWYGYGTVA